MSSGDDGSRADLDTRRAILQARLASLPRDVVCIDESFRSSPFPDEVVALGVDRELRRHYEVGEVSENLSAADNAKVMKAVRDARQGGVATAVIHPFDADGPVVLTMIDFLDEYGVVLAINIDEDASTDLEPVDVGPGARPRRAVQHRDQVAQFIWVDPNTEAMLGYGAEGLLGRSALEFVHPDDHDRGIDGWLAMLSGEPDTRHRLRWMTADGGWRWLELTHTNRLEDLGYVETEMLDVDDEMAALARARAGELQFNTLTESLPVGVAQVDPDGQIIYINAWLRSLSGVGGEDLTRSLLRAFDEDDQELLKEATRLTAEGESSDLRVRLRTTTGAHRQCNVRVRPLAPDGEYAGAIASIEDVTESAALQAELRLQAETDGLTGLANRSALIRHLEPMLDKTRAERSGLALLFFDLDGFKLVNDGLGHEAGDDLLVDVARRVKRLLRPTDLVARVGGDEFVVVCPWATAFSDAGQIASRLISEVQQAFHWSTDSTSINCSVGVVLYDGADDGTVTADQLISNADLAMYKAKRAGGGRWEWYDAQLREEMTRTLDLQRRIVDSLRSDEFRLHLQPIRDLVSGETVAAECLLRWLHPTAERVSTEQLIQVAEHSGLIVPLGRWVLDQACAVAAEAAAAGYPDLRISINLSGRQLSHGGFERDLTEALERHGVAAEQLVLEVTETVFIGPDGNIVETIRALADRGCAIALDDFGTGYSSLNQLRLMPANILKIDCSYTADLATDAGTAAITRALVELCRDLGIELVAEGIETEAHAELVTDMGIRLGQGYHLARPMPADRFFATLDRSSQR